MNYAGLPGAQDLIQESEIWFCYVNDKYICISMCLACRQDHWFSVMNFCQTGVCKLDLVVVVVVMFIIPEFGRCGKDLCNDICVSHLQAFELGMRKSEPGVKQDFSGQLLDCCKQVECMILHYKWSFGHFNLISFSERRGVQMKWISR